MRKIDKSDWFKEGIGILETKGFAFVTIENLCSILHVTKGSFYHHFKNMDGYIEALMEYWLQENTFAFIERANAESDSFARQQTLYDLSLYASHSSEQSIRAWSYSNPIVKKYVQQADGLRLDYLNSLRKEGNMPADRARYSAMLEYAVLIGLQQLYPDLPKDDLKHLQDIFSINMLKKDR